MHYSTKRRLAVLGFFLVIILLFSFYIYKKYFENNPTCFDGIKNGKEEDIDCGGSCQKICPFKVSRVNKEWSRAFKINDNGYYNIVALVQNPNFTYKVKADYTLRYLNDQGIPVGEKKGNVSISPLEERVIFYQGEHFENQNIIKTFLKIDKIYDLEEVSEPTKYPVIVNAKEVFKEEGDTKLKLVIENTDYKAHREIQVFAFLYGDNENVINMSRTYIDYLDAGERKEVYMTWPIKIKEKVSNIKILFKEERL